MTREAYLQWRNELILDGYVDFAVAEGSRQLTTVGRLRFVSLTTEDEILFAGDPVISVYSGTADSIILFRADGTPLGVIPGLVLTPPTTFPGVHLTIDHFTIKRSIYE